MEWVQYNGPLAFQPDLLAAAERIATDAIARWQQARCGGGRTGGVLVRHRFGSSVNLTIHGHLLVVDGVFAKDTAGNLVFERAPPIRREEFDALAATIHRRFTTLLRRRGLLREHDSVNNEAEQLDALGACGRLALSTGRREKHGPALSLADEDEVERPAGGLTANTGGLNLYASAPIAADDRGTLEKLCRYLLRGPLALSRLRERPDGLLEYRMKKPDRRGNTVLVLTPMELMMRIASLVPAPRFPTRKYWGILAAGAKDRRLVVPSPTRRRGSHCDDGKKPAVQSPVKWADLLKRIFNLEALDCPRCGSRMRPLAVIEDKVELARLLAHLGESTVHARSRAPPELAA